MNNWKTKCVGLQRTWVSKRTVLYIANHYNRFGSQKWHLQQPKLTSEYPIYCLSQSSVPPSRGERPLQDDNGKPKSRSKHRVSQGSWGHNPDSVSESWKPCSTAFSELQVYNGRILTGVVLVWSVTSVAKGTSLDLGSTIISYTVKFGMCLVVGGVVIAILTIKINNLCRFEGVSYYH